VPSAPRLILALVLTLLGLLAALPGQAGGGGSDPTCLVYVVPVQGTIDRGLPGTVSRTVRLARSAGADLVVLEVSTLGGRVDAALEIRDTVLACPIPTVALIRDRAWSAGALVALAADTIFMQPGSSIGAAEPRPAEVKEISALRGEFEATAERTGRDRTLAAAMVDRSIEIEGVVEQGMLLVLSAARAVELGLAEGVARDLEEALSMLGYRPTKVVRIHPTPGERLARFVTDPVVAGLLLSFGIIGVVAELLTPGFGVPGTVGLTCLGLFFGGHLLAGLGGWEAAALFVVGMALLGAEAFVPGFGVFGIAGVAAMLGSVYLFTGGGTDALKATAVALVVTVGGSILLLRLAARKGLLDRLALGVRLGREEGVLARVEPEELVGQTGTAVTPFRPAGILEVDGRRIDAVSEGAFIPAGTPVRIVSVEGPRVLVRAIEGR